MIKGTVTGGREVIANLTRMPGSLQANLAATITRLCFKLQVHVERDKLSGQVLKAPTGHLRRSITVAVTNPSASSVQGTVGTNVAYGRFFELGFSGTENVREHLRTMTQAFGKPVKDPRKITVHAHSRHVDMPARSFLGSALKDMSPEILSAIAATVKESTK